MKVNSFMLAYKQAWEMRMFKDAMKTESSNDVSSICNGCR